LNDCTPEHSGRGLRLVDIYLEFYFENAAYRIGRHCFSAYHCTKLFSRQRIKTYRGFISFFQQRPLTVRYTSFQYPFAVARECIHDQYSCAGTNYFARVCKLFNYKAVSRCIDSGICLIETGLVICLLCHIERRLSIL
jgi:hypothetical protein